MMKAGRGGRGGFQGVGPARLPSPGLLLAFFFFFLAGFYFSLLFFRQDVPPAPTVVPRTKVREVVTKNFDIDFEFVMPSVTTIPFQILSWRPRTLYLPNFASSEQCESIINVATERLTPSGLVMRNRASVETTKRTRTSTGAFVKASEDKTGSIDFLEKKISNFTMIPTYHGETFNILRYEIGQRYLAHYDAFHPALFTNLRSQRIISVLIYLSDVEDGGETMFPFESGLNMNINYDYKECIGMKVRPRKGDAVLFYSTFPNGTMDPVLATAVHGSCPVIRGEKWVATKWVRDQKLKFHANHPEF